MVTADCIGKELRQLFKGISKCSIKKMNEDNQYLITFPSESIREQFSRFRGFDFQTSIVKVKVIPTKMSYGVDDNLDVVWVKAFNLPSNAKNVEIIMEVAYLVGDPEEVDTTSLKKPRPVRIKLVCRDASQVRGETQIFFNGEVTDLNRKWRIWVKRLPKMIPRVSSIEGKMKRMRKRRKKKRVNMLQVRRRGGAKNGDGGTKTVGTEEKSGNRDSNKKQKMMEQTTIPLVGKEQLEHVDMGKNMSEGAVVEVSLSQEVVEEGEIEVSTESMEILEEDCNCEVGGETGHSLEEELLDYGDDPLLNEKAKI